MNPSIPKHPQRVESPHEKTFQVPGSPVVPVPPGCVRLRKIRGCALFQIWYPGDVEPYETLVHSKNFNNQLVQRGFDPERVEWIADYVWNFGEAIVRLMPDFADKPKPVKYE